MRFIKRTKSVVQLWTGESDLSLKFCYLQTKPWDQNRIRKSHRVVPFDILRGQKKKYVCGGGGVCKENEMWGRVRVVINRTGGHFFRGDI